MTLLTDIVDFGELETEIENGYVKANRHPFLPLTIYTYTRPCQYEGHWNDVTTMCRGLIVEDSGRVVARPFRKFFNYGEHGERDYAPALDTHRPFKVYDKVDGSLGILFCYGGKWLIASKGSFTSEQAVWAQERIEKAQREGPDLLENLDPYLTYCCEIVAPWNRIVVNYGDREDLVLLGIYGPEGREIPLTDVAPYWPLGSIVTLYGSMPLESLLEACGGNRDIIWGDEVTGTEWEGFVLKFEDGQRVKVKYAEYVRLHRILTGISERDVWRALAFDAMQHPKIETFSVETLATALKCSGGLVREMLASGKSQVATIVEGCPDELDKWVQGIVSDLLDCYADLKSTAKHTLNLIKARLYEDGFLGQESEFRGRFARLANDCPDRTIRSALFTLLDNKSIAPLLWKSLYPSSSTPFREDG